MHPASSVVIIPIVPPVLIRIVRQPSATNHAASIHRHATTRRSPWTTRISAALSHAWALRRVVHEIIPARCDNHAGISQCDSDAPFIHDDAPSMRLAEAAHAPNINIPSIADHYWVRHARTGTFRGRPSRLLAVRMGVLPRVQLELMPVRRCPTARYDWAL